MPEYEWEKLEIECPEGHGGANQTFKVLLHYSSRRGRRSLDRKAISEWECDLRDELLKRGESCGESCEKTDVYKHFVHSITTI